MGLTGGMTGGETGRGIGPGAGAIGGGGDSSFFGAGGGLATGMGGFGLSFGVCITSSITFLVDKKHLKCSQLS